ncbi:alpha/beta hydrolase [Planomonospora sp. ID67723]|uniref:alpha/beta hydrolase family protein n=1 Tax=Planomonospora sp. ID67723 TaxID=2738134 RepID=UPI0018C39830|nr:alpha/beta hydrolase [Planomonospora sp. ID67723]MBG0827764.1 alpha/beta hydrolase [Planomonospora sp. ID67723]
MRAWLPRLCVTLAALLLLTAAPAYAAPARTAADLAAPGSHAVGYSDVSVSASGRSFSARVYYPAMSEGSNRAVAAGRFPVVSFGHGFFQNIGKYASLGRHWASWGMITIMPASQGGLFPSHGAFADDLNAALTWMVQQDTAGGSRFNAHVRTDRLALSGHSMGGGASVLAAARNPSVRAVTNLAAAETNPSAKAAAATTRVPMQLVAGSQDTVAGPSGHQIPIYGAKLPSKQLRTITGGFHCGFTDSGGFGCDSGSISRAVQQSITQRVTTSWLLYYLADDTGQYDAVWGAAAQTDPAVQFLGVE